LNVVSVSEAGLQWINQVNFINVGPPYFA